MTDHSLIAEQEALEEVMVRRGTKRFLDMLDRARDSSNPSEDTTPAVIIAMSRAIDPVADEVTAWVEKVVTAPGRRALASLPLSQLDPRVVGLLTLKAMMRGVSHAKALTSVAMSVGKEIEDEYRFQAFAQECKPLYETIRARLAKHSNRAYKSRVLNAALKKHDLGPEWWTMPTRLRVGMACIDIVLRATDYFEIGEAITQSRARTSRGGNHLTKVIRGSKRLMSWFKNKEQDLSILSPVYLPMIAPPRPWTTTRGGGYLTEQVTRTYSLVKHGRPAYIDELADRDMPDVYEALNLIQEVPWKVNRFVYDVAWGAFDRGLPIAGLPSGDDIPLPPKPHDISTNEEALRKWKKEAHSVHHENSRLGSIRLQAVSLLDMARQVVDREAIYFPHNLDFRGRIYPLPGPLSPQGPDLAKGLLQFSRGTTIAGPVAAGWLAVHGANCWGYDKVSLEDRIAWVEEHEERIVAIAEDPMGDLWWTEADAPWCFLAWCREWADWLKTGYGFVSSLPIGLDGSCSGIQHFSAMLRDEVGGAAVNLVPADKPSDIYQTVADRLSSVLQALAKHGTDDEARFAGNWLAFGIDRKLCKRPVMILPYGGTVAAIRKYTQDRVDELRGAGLVPWDKEEDPQHRNFLAPIMWDAIGDVVIAARAVMKWLRECVAACMKKEKAPFVWVAPSGFPVRQLYPELTEIQVKTQLGDAIIKPVLHIEDRNSLISTRRQQAGVSPNFVHSLDASHLVSSVITARDNGVDDIGVVHDCFLTTAGNVEVLGASLRAAMVDLYEHNDVLASFKVALEQQFGVELPEPPARGNLDLKAILRSDFTFA